MQERMKFNRFCALIASAPAGPRNGRADPFKVLTADRIQPWFHPKLLVYQPDTQPMVDISQIELSAEQVEYVATLGRSQSGQHISIASPQCNVSYSLYTYVGVAII